MPVGVALEDIDWSHAVNTPANAGLAICWTCYIVQPCLNGLVVALSKLLPPLPARTVEDHYNLIADNPVLIPMLLSVAAVQATYSGKGRTTPPDWSPDGSVRRAADAERRVSPASDYVSCFG